jgi:hypothetical protein
MNKYRIYQRSWLNTGLIELSSLPKQINTLYLRALIFIHNMQNRFAYLMNIGSFFCMLKCVK